MDKAYKLLLDPEQKKRALDVIEAGKEYVEHNVSSSVCEEFNRKIPVRDRFCPQTGKGEEEAAEERREMSRCGGGRPGNGNDNSFKCWKKGLLESHTLH